jgi:hypothetical protein
MLGLVILILVLLIIFLNNNRENFRTFWNVSPSTRNMSYDLRCEPKIPKRNYAFHGSSIEPLHRPKCLTDIR